MTKKRTMQSELATIFRRIKKRETFQSPSISGLRKHLDRAIVSAAIAKCVEMNLLINQQGAEGRNAFLFIANLRGMAEDLIVLQFLLRMPQAKRRKLLDLRHQHTLHATMLAQLSFFEVNNPFQPVAGGRRDKLESQFAKDEVSLRSFWATEGKFGKNGPSVKAMAADAGLSQTYEYIYFLSSNFVHFNTHTLIRMGWGPEEGPFEFSLHNFSGYYADLASFYGAVLFVGFFSRIGKGHFSDAAKSDAEAILRIIDEVPRWPELVTFEEMNQRPPMLPFLAHAMRKATEGEGIPFGAILREVRGI